jgi:hypothetical protein
MGHPKRKVKDMLNPVENRWIEGDVRPDEPIKGTVPW